MRSLIQSDAELAYLTAGVVPQLGQACGEDEFRNPITGECQPYPWAEPSEPEPPEVPAPSCGPGWIDKEGACVCYGEVDETTGICHPAGPQLPPDFVAPGAVPVRPENWDLEAEPYALYTLAWGDTYVGLAATYLGDGARWREIWDLNRTITPDPDKIGVGQTINMPEEARQKMKRWLQGPKKDLPGKLPDEPPLAEKAKKAAPYLLIGLAAAGLVYYVAQS